MEEQRIHDFRVEFGDTATPYVFTDDEIDYFITKSDGNFTRAKILCIDRLIAENRSLHSFSAGSRSGSPGEVVDRLFKWREQLVAALKDENPPAADFAGGVERWR